MHKRSEMRSFKVVGKTGDVRCTNIYAQDLQLKVVRLSAKRKPSGFRIKAEIPIQREEELRTRVKTYAFTGKILQ